MNILHRSQGSLYQFFSPKKILCLGAMLLGTTFITPTESAAQWSWAGSHIYNANMGQGNVGIGTTIPSVDLHIHQDVGDAGAAAPTVGFSLAAPNTAIMGELLLEQLPRAHSNFSLSGDFILRALPDTKVPGGSLILTNKAAGKNMYFATTYATASWDTPRMSILHNGHVGVGAAPGALPLQPVGRFTVNNEIVLQDGGWPFVGFNTYWGTTPPNQSSGQAADRRISKGKGARMIFDKGQGNLHFQMVSDAAAETIFANGPNPVGTAPFALSITNSGNVGIGVMDPQYAKLAVDGLICAKEVRVSEGSPCWPDFVFEDSYQLLSLEQVEHSIKKNKHLPGIPSAAEVKANGIELGDMQAKLLQKVEELTLYMIDMKKNITTLQQENETLKKQITTIHKEGR